MPPELPTGRGWDPEGPIVILGDTQRTTCAEGLVGREQNEEARRALIAKIASEERPAFLVHLGDMVADGSSAWDWAYFDRLMRPLTTPGVRILPVLGNHEYWGNQEEMLDHLRRRFPEFRRSGGNSGRTFYARQHTMLGLIWLDTGLQGCAAAAQTVWFRRELAQFDRNPALRAVLVFGHVPPYTEGVGCESNAYVTSQVVPALLGSRKAIALFSGHVHGYERFSVKPRTFVVSGGGGGPRVRYRFDDRKLPSAAYFQPSGEPRPFNYLVVELHESGLWVTAKCIVSPRSRDEDSECEEGRLERFWLAFPAQSTSARRHP